MNARHELAREAERILLDAGCVTARAQHYGPFWALNGMRADEREVSGHTRDQADPQDPRDLARRLAAQFAVKPEPEVEEIPEAPETVEETFAPGEGPFDPAPEPEQNRQDETHGETVQTADDAAREDAAHVSEHDADPSSGDDASDDGEQSGRDDYAEERGADPGLVLDADFTLDTIELIEPEEPDFGRELLEFEDELAGEPAPAADAAGAFIFGDNLHQMRTAAMGLVVQSALTRLPTVDYTQLSEYRNFAMGVAEGRWPDDPARRETLLVLEDVERLRRRVEAERDAKIEFLLTATREQIEAFDVEDGWP